MFKKNNSINQRRADYVGIKYKDFLKGKILDVGCRDKRLKQYLDENTEYIGIDFAGNPDINVNLEEEKIPFPDNSFDCVVCLDVLEHLENLHKTFDELIRVSKKYVILSLPNCYSSNFFKIITVKGKTKHYGLPLENPRDRHRWFFNYTEAERFIIERAKKNNVSDIRIHPFIRNKPIRNFILKLIFRERYKDISALCTWALIKK